MYKRLVLKLFESVNVITYEKNSLDYDIKVIDESFYFDLVNTKTLGLAEGYMNKKFTSLDLRRFLIKLSKLNNIERIISSLYWYEKIIFIPYLIRQILVHVWSWMINNQSIIRSRRVAEEHYNLPLKLYKNMLGETMSYSCSYWSNEAVNLDEAQINKIWLIIEKLQPKDGDKILEIGCGWGYTAYIIANEYPRCQVTGITISKEQFEYCKQNYNLKNLIFQLIDYREVKCRYDKIYSVGFFEHVGINNYQAFFDLTYDLLEDGGIMITHCICRDKRGYNYNEFIDKYIFPGGELGSISQIIQASEESKFVLEDVHQFGLYYARTLNEWSINFMNNYSKIKDDRLDDRFFRMWLIYLTMSSVGFKTKSLRLAQFVFTKNFKKVYNRNEFDL